jgi:hypothetical protein
MSTDGGTGPGTELALYTSATPAWRTQVHMSRRLLTSLFIVAGIAVLLPSDAMAQRRGPSRGSIFISPQRTVIYPPWYGPWGYPYGYGGGYPYPYPGQYPYRYYSDDADLRIQTTPRETEVYVDGAQAGIVDDFDGVFQRLHLRPGEHEITLYLQGYRSWSERRYFGPRSDQRILHTMLPLAAGQPDDPRPTRPAAMNPPVQDRDPRYDPRDPRDPGYDRPMPRRDPRPLPMPEQPRNQPPPTEPSPPPTPTVDPRSFGTLSVSVNPSDAEITLDEQKQRLTNGNRLSIQLSEGVHHLVIKKNGYGTFETDLQIRRGRTLSFDVNLIR